MSQVKGARVVPVGESGAVAEKNITERNVLRIDCSRYMFADVQKAAAVQAVDAAGLVLQLVPVRSEAAQGTRVHGSTERPCADHSNDAKVVVLNCRGLRVDRSEVVPSSRGRHRLDTSTRGRSATCARR